MALPLWVLVHGMHGWVQVCKPHTTEEDVCQGRKGRSPDAGLDGTGVGGRLGDSVSRCTQVCSWLCVGELCAGCAWLVDAQEGEEVIERGSGQGWAAIGDGVMH